MPSKICTMPRGNISFYKDVFVPKLLELHNTPGAWPMIGTQQMTAVRVLGPVSK